MPRRSDLRDRDVIAALLGMQNIPPLVEGSPPRAAAVAPKPLRRATANPPGLIADAATRYCVLLVVLEDTTQAMRRLRPMVSRVDGIAFDLTVRDAVRRASEVAAYA